MKKPGLVLAVTLLACLAFTFDIAWAGSASDGCVSAGAEMAAAAAGGTQSSSSNSNGGAPSWSFSGGGSSGGGGSVSISGSQLQGMYNAGAFSGGSPFSATSFSSLSSGIQSAVANILSSNQLASIQSMSTGIMTISGPINLQGVPLVTNLGQIPASQNWTLSTQTQFGDVYKDGNTGQLFGQSATGQWHTVDAQGNWGASLNEAFKGSGLIIGGTMVSNQAQYGPDPSTGYQIVAPTEDGKSYMVLNVKAENANKEEVSLAGIGVQGPDGLVVAQLDASGQPTGRNVTFIGSMGTNPVNR